LIGSHCARFEAEVRAYRLREVREEQGLTQVELAERMQVTQPTVSQLEVVADFGDRRLVLG
jgi:DNA-binding XRE family transcriptional regulator